MVIWSLKKRLKKERKEGSLQETHEEIYTSSDEADAQRREEEEAGGGALASLTPAVLDVEENVKMDSNRKMDGSSDWSGRESRSRDSSSLSKRDKREQFDELKGMI